MFRIYTSGATACDQLRSHEWRIGAKRIVEDMSGVKVFVPDDYYDYSSNRPKTVKECKSMFLFQVSISDIILVNLTNSSKSVGTGFEMQCAIDNGIPIIGFYDNGVKEGIYEWTKESCDVIFDSVEEAMNYIMKYYILA